MLHLVLIVAVVATFMSATNLNHATIHVGYGYCRENVKEKEKHVIESVIVGAKIADCRNLVILGVRFISRHSS